MSKSLAFACISVATLAAVSLWGWRTDPSRHANAALVALFIPSLWIFVALAQPGDRARSAAVVKWHRLCFGWASILLACFLALEVAVSGDMLSPAWAPAILRFRGVAFGAGLMLWGNYLPKLKSPWSLAEQPFDWQGVHRFVGWGASIAGLSVAAVWMTMPPDQARPLTIVIVTLTSGMAVVRKFLSLGVPGDGANTSCR